MSFRRASLAALTALCTVNCASPAAEDSGGSPPTLTATAPSATGASWNAPKKLSSPGGKNLVRMARVEGYANPATGEAWMKLVGAGQPSSLDTESGVAVSSSALLGTGAPGYCEAVEETMGNGAIGSTNTPAFEWFTWGVVDAGMRLANSDSAVDGPTCYGHLSGAFTTAHPGLANLYGAVPGPTTLCFRQRLGNYTGQDNLHVYFDIDRFSGDPLQEPYGFGQAEHVIQASSLASVRNTPDQDLGLWDLGVLNDNETTDVWFMFRNGAITAYRWDGYLLLEVQEECDDIGDTTDEQRDDDCDGVINNGCATFSQGDGCFEDSDCASGTCNDNDVIIRSGYGVAGTDLNADGTSLNDDVPGTCVGAAGDPCTTDEDCATNLACAAATTCVGNGALRFTYQWAASTDLDSYVQTPGSGTLGYGQLSLAGGGEWDVDDTGGTGPNIENINFDVAPVSGSYPYWLQNYSGVAPVEYTINVYENGVLTATQSGTVGSGMGTNTTHFSYQYPASCGDGVLNVGEACDDDNTSGGDGCSASCTIEAFTLGGTVTGDFTGGRSVTLYDSESAQSAVITASGSYTFPSPVFGGSTRDVTVASANGLYCTVIRSTGTAQANVTNMNVSCSPAGTVDSSFATFHVQNSGHNVLNAVAVQSDNKVLVGGRNQISTISEWNIYRLNPDGSADTSWGTGGLATLGISPNSLLTGVRCLAVQPDGKVIAVGSTNITQIAIARFNTDGSLDVDFGTGGITYTDATAFYDDPADCHLFADGSIMVLANTLTNNNDWDQLLVKYTSGGVLDTSFSGDGIFAVTDTSHDTFMNAMDVSATRIALVGRITYTEHTLDGNGNPTNGNTGTTIMLLDHNGAFDTGFNGGFISVELGGVGFDEARDVKILGDGRVVFTGWHQDASAFYESFIARLNTNGTWDSGFAGGAPNIGEGTSLDDRMLSMLVMPDGSYLVGGYRGANMAFRHISSSGVVNTSFGTAGWLATTAGYSSGRANAMALDSAGRVVAAGQLDVNNPDFGAIRVLPTGGRAIPTALVFGTSTAYQGYLVGGVAGADAACQARADAASLGGTFRAWLSTSGSSVASRFTRSEGPYDRTDGAVVANNWVDLTDGSLQTTISVDEFGVSFGGWPVWTATNPNGSYTGGLDCGGWTAVGGDGNNGNSASSTASWSWTSGSQTICTNYARFYCFQQ